MGPEKTYALFCFAFAYNFPHTCFAYTVDICHRNILSFVLFFAIETNRQGITICLAIFDNLITYTIRLGLRKA